MSRDSTVKLLKSKDKKESEKQSEKKKTFYFQMGNNKTNS